MTDVEVKDVEMKEEEVPVEEAEVVEAEGAEDVEMKEEVKEEVKEPEVVENEPSEEASEAKRFAGELKLATEDASVNAQVSSGSIINSITIGGQHLIAGSRANMGMKAGRYMVEYCLLSFEHRFGEVKLGFSLPNGSHFLGEKNTLGFQVSTSKCVSYNGEENKEMKRLPKGVRQGDVLGVYLNRTNDIGNSNTISLFINGVRHGDSVEVPDSFKDQVMVPHCTIKSAVLELNLSKAPRVKYPFVPRVFGDASDSDVVAIKMAVLEKSEVIVPVGNVTKEWKEKFLTSKSGEQITDLSVAGFREWYLKSGAKMKGHNQIDHDFRLFMEKMIAMKKRKYLVSFNNNLQKKDRKALTAKLGNHTKISALVDDDLLNSLPKTSQEYELYSIPVIGEVEGFNNGVQFTESLEKSQELFKAWVQNNRAHAKVEGLKPSTTYKEKLAEWKKYADEQKKALKGEKAEAKKEEPKEGEEVKEETPAACETIENMKEWTPEDWMLADLRYELHLLIRCFRGDVEALIVQQAEEKAKKAEEEGAQPEEDEVDPPFTTFTLNNLDHYYRLYASKALNPNTWGVKKTAEIVNFVKDAVVFEGASEDVVTSNLSNDVELLKILELTESARQERNDRLTAGDERAILPFKAPKPNQPQRINKGATTTGAVKGQKPGGVIPKGGKGHQPHGKGHGVTSAKGSKGTGKGADGKGQNKLSNMRMVPTASVGGVKRPGEGGNPAPAKRFNKGSW